jgi:hypothetical protein
VNARDVKHLKDGERNFLGCHFIVYEEHSKDRQLNEERRRQFTPRCPVQVKWASKLGPVKHPPPTARRFNTEVARAMALGDPTLCRRTIPSELKRQLQ